MNISAQKFDPYLTIPKPSNYEAKPKKTGRAFGVDDRKSQLQNQDGGFIMVDIFKNIHIGCPLIFCLVKNFKEKSKYKSISNLRDTSIYIKTYTVFATL